MESSVLDPFEDYQTAGYLHNTYGEKNLLLVGHLETAAFEQEVLGCLRFLRRRPSLQYQDITDTHHRMFNSLYPWAGQDRSVTAPDLKIVKGGFRDLFAHPADCRRSAEYALRIGQDAEYLRAHPGEVFGFLAHAHPFLEGNGRTILTIFADLARRATFHVNWEAIDKEQFLTTLTRELQQPSKQILDKLVLPYARSGVLSSEVTARRLRTNFNSRRLNPPSAT